MSCGRKLGLFDRTIGARPDSLEGPKLYPCRHRKGECPAIMYHYRRPLFAIAIRT